MAGENIQQPGDGVNRPVIPLQNQEPAIEIIEDDAARTVQPAGDFPHEASDTERPGSYEYDPDDEGQPADARTGHAQQGADEQPQAGETQDQLTARQRRRRAEKSARDRERAELVRLRTENAQLRQGHQQLDARLTGVEQAGIDGQISSLQEEIRRANMVMKRAMEAQNADDFVQAQEIRDAFRDRLGKLQTQKEEQGQQRQQQTQEAPMAPGGFTQAQVAYGRIFASRHPWFNVNPGVRHGDSDMVRQLDNELLAEGANPSTPEYWVELERRVKEDMPHKFQTAANEGGNAGGQQNGGGQQPRQNGRGNGANGRPAGGPKMPGTGAGGSGAGGGSVKFHLSAARKQAMIDSGQWEDPERRDRQIKYFMKWDAENPSKG